MKRYDAPEIFGFSVDRRHVYFFGKRLSPRGVHNLIKAGDIAFNTSVYLQHTRLMGPFRFPQLIPLRWTPVRISIFPITQLRIIENAVTLNALTDTPSYPPLEEPSPMQSKSRLAPSILPAEINLVPYVITLGSGEYSKEITIYANEDYNHTLVTAMRNIYEVFDTYQPTQANYIATVQALSLLLCTGALQSKREYPARWEVLMAHKEIIRLARKQEVPRNPDLRFSPVPCYPFLSPQVAAMLSPIFCVTQLILPPKYYWLVILNLLLPLSTDILDDIVASN